MALPFRTTGSLRPSFDPARRVCLAVKHPCCLCTLCAISDRAEGTFVLLRYPLGGDRPSQTTHHTRSPTPLPGSGLELQTDQGGISRVAPWGLASPLQSLPPILHKPVQSPV